VEHDGVQRRAEEWLSSTGRARKVEGARVTFRPQLSKSSVSCSWATTNRGCPRYSSSLQALDLAAYDMLIEQEVAA